MCAVSIASPSSSSTSDGGMTMPSVLAMQIVAVASAGRDGPRFASAGATARASMCRLAPTEPFIGASRAPTPSAESCAEAGLRANSRSPPACISRCQRQAIEQRADEGVERQRLQQVVLEQADEPRRQDAEQGDVERTAGDADRGEDRRHGKQHGIDRQAGRRS